MVSTQHFNNLLVKLDHETPGIWVNIKKNSWKHHLVKERSTISLLITFKCFTLKLQKIYIYIFHLTISYHYVPGTPNFGVPIKWMVIKVPINQPLGVITLAPLRWCCHRVNPEGFLLPGNLEVRRSSCEVIRQDGHPWRFESKQTRISTGSLGDIYIYKGTPPMPRLPPKKQGLIKGLLTMIVP